jgi:hypothetical protein
MVSLPATCVYTEGSGAANTLCFVPYSTAWPQYIILSEERGDPIRVMVVVAQGHVARH